MSTRTESMDTQSDRNEAQSEPTRERHPAKQVYGDTDVARIADVSPEGPPADPVLPSSGIALLITCSVIAVLIASLLTGVLVSAAAGWGVFVVSLLLAVVVNPVIYASVLRARERHAALER